MNEEVEAYMSPMEVKRRSVHYFTNLFTKLPCELNYKPWFPKIVTPKMNIWLEQILMEGEVMVTIDKMSVEKA